MSVIGTETSPRGVGVDERPWVVNDFAIVAATVNGSGSQTANNTLIRAIFKMGIPVSGKNMFPSNIAGLPTVSAIQPNPAGGTDAFVTKLNASGSALVFSTYLGGALDDAATGTVRLRRDVQKIDEMALDTASTKTTRVKR